MYENVVRTAQERLNAAVTLAKQHADEGVNMITDIKEWVDTQIPANTLEYHTVCCTLFEAIGDIRMRQRGEAQKDETLLKQRYLEAETAFKSMIEEGKKMYEITKNADMRLGMAYYKLASCWRTFVGCHVFNNRARQLTEGQMKVYEAGLNVYQSALGVTNENARKGSGRHLDFRASILADVAVMRAALGAYDDAEKYDEESIRIFKAIYQQLDNKDMGYKLASIMGNLATIYTFNRKVDKAQETLEDAIFVLKEHEEDDPMRSGLMLARYYLNVAGCYVGQHAEKELIDDAYENGKKKITEVNKKVEGRLAGDEITCYMLSGNYYKTHDEPEKGNADIKHALDLASEMLEKTGNKQFENMKNQLEVMLNRTPEQAKEEMKKVIENAAKSMGVDDKTAAAAAEQSVSIAEADDTKA